MTQEEWKYIRKMTILYNIGFVVIFTIGILVYVNYQDNKIKAMVKIEMNGINEKLDTIIDLLK